MMWYMVFKRSNISFLLKRRIILPTGDVGMQFWGFYLQENMCCVLMFLHRVKYEHFVKLRKRVKTLVVYLRSSGRYFTPLDLTPLITTDRNIFPSRNVARWWELINCELSAVVQHQDLCRSWRNLLTSSDCLIHCTSEVNPGSQTNVHVPLFEARHGPSGPKHPITEPASSSSKGPGSSLTVTARD